MGDSYPREICVSAFYVAFSSSNLQKGSWIETKQVQMQYLLVLSSKFYESPEL